MFHLEPTMAKCDHLSEANLKVKPSGRKCKQCEALGQRPVELRMCLICGNVACCDSSPGRHATKHFQETGHAVMKAYKSGDWIWCYVHQSYM
jgi:monovalent cation/hydrogen antiporter